ncbi:hypothetical protein PanWU01x14_319360 [Parasponia andersonii]|uniref:Uncharacterized protein n=1 Tax=Parasponia andersonii TaxID=3476 RepID=A0A2P5ALZ6_PARAD|nr:hypothetical protein PanWU01x14_319360 [Parasponia andersonii]
MILKTNRSMWWRGLGLAVGRLVAVEEGGEVGGEVGVERDDFRDVAVDLLYQSHVLHHVVRDPGLVVLVHLLYQSPVPIQNRLYLSEALVEVLPNLWVPFLLPSSSSSYFSHF